jgi:hypothetical protein
LPSNGKESAGYSSSNNLFKSYCKVFALSAIALASGFGGLGIIEYSVFIPSPFFVTVKS